MVEWWVMRRINLLVMALLIAFEPIVMTSAPAQGQPASPFNVPNISGVWVNNGGAFVLRQNGGRISGELTAQDFTHHFEGEFVAANRVHGQYNPRLDRRTQCKTIMDVNILLTGANSFVLDWQALDSNCDLQRGWRGTDEGYTRASALLGGAQPRIPQAYQSPSPAPQSDAALVQRELARRQEVCRVAYAGVNSCQTNAQYCLNECRQRSVAQGGQGWDGAGYQVCADSCLATQNSCGAQAMVECNLYQSGATPLP